MRRPCHAADPTPLRRENAKINRDHDGNEEDRDVAQRIRALELGGYGHAEQSRVAQRALRRFILENKEACREAAVLPRSASTLPAASAKIVALAISPRFKGAIRLRTLSKSV